ncbi:MAG TPA: alkaline phosphatase PhoX [Acidimicrobiales bacterium]|nr:alkaline phosphatase PhoX [Acidimicrobiales bacterium]
MPSLDRRSFLAGSAVVAGGAVTLGNSFFGALNAGASTASPELGTTGGHGPRGGYGPLRRVPDQDGAEVLALPEGFRYVTFSKIGDTMSDGTPVPRAHDGMGAFPSRRGDTLLIRNHEVRTAPGTVLGSVQGPAELRYDPVAGGGTTSLLFDTRRGRFLRDWVSFSGSIVNCAGGIAYQEAGWVTSEETVNGPNQGFGRKHGYNFLVPATTDGPVAAVPLTAMGRFAHEAIAVDPRTGYVYETEDSGNDSGFYRFRPLDESDLAAGGTLEMLAVAGQDGYNAITGQQVGRRLPVRWVPIDTPDPDLEANPGAEVALEGIGKGAAAFNRLEGIWYDPDTEGFFFNSTSGGDAHYGQVWHYSPRDERLTLFFESPGGSVLDSPDNLLVTPRGGILLCEDDASGTDGDTHPLAPGITDVNRLIGLTRRGDAFEFAVNTLNDAEFAGACFSPDATTLFVNIFGSGDVPGSGMTCAITGPWRRGAL